MKKILLSTFAAGALCVTAAAQAYIPNSGFETWGNTAGEQNQPTGWISYNVFTFMAWPGNPTSVTAAGSPDNYQGNYSARIQTVDLVNNPDTTAIPNRAGVLYTGNVAFTTPYMFPGYASQQRPQSMSYWTKYTPSGTDSAWALVALTKWNGTSQDTIAVGFDNINSAIAAYSQRSLVLQYNGAFNNVQPDTISIMFSASSVFAPQTGSVLFVDEVAFSGYVGINETDANNGVSVYPNPSASVTQFDVVVDNASQVIVYDMTGREVQRGNFFGKVARLNTAAMADGNYSYSIVDKNQEVLSRGQFAVAH